MRGELNVWPFSFSQSQGDSGRIWMLSYQGFLYSAPSLREAWTFESRVRAPWNTDAELSETWNGSIIYVSETDSLLVVSLSDSTNDHGLEETVLLRSKDRGRSWEVIRLPNDTLIKWVTTDLKGRIWASCTNGELVHSTDEGWTWAVVRPPDADSSFVSSIMMLDSLNGVAGTSSEKLIITTDNWRSSRAIPAPRTYSPDPGWPDQKEPRIQMVLLFNNVVYAKKLDRISYCSLSDTVWHTLPHSIHRLSIDRANRRGLGVTANGAILSFHSPREFDTLGTHEYLRPDDPILIFGKDVAVLTRDGLWFVKESTLTETVLLSAENKATPEQQMRVKTGYIGISPRFVYYSSSGADSTWQRMVMLPDNTSQPTLLNDSVVILKSWKGYVQVNLHTWQLSAYRHHNPISSFLDHDIEKLSVQFGFRSCYEPPENSRIVFHRISSGDLVCSTWIDCTEEIQHADTISIAELRAGLDRFNEEPYRKMAIRRLGFTPIDVDSFITLGERVSFGIDPPQKTKIDSITAYLRSLPSIDSTIPFTVDIDRRKHVISTSWGSVAIEIVNANGDTLTLARRLNGSPSILYPLTVRFNQFEHEIMDPAIPYCIGQALPPTFDGRYLFHRFSIIDYLTRKRMNDFND